ncbi:MAG: hypothetical protein FJ100_21065 [Deltaproteobacteria bacterium]|nr:hypothetical protein [Deltaproteobacteria bacterium]
MKAHYDFESADVRRNPYAAQLNQRVQLHVPRSALAFFESVATAQGITVEAVMQLYLREAAASGRQLQWPEAAPAGESRKRA